MAKEDEVSNGDEKKNWCFFYEECKDLSYKFGVLMKEFDQLNEILYE